MCHSRSGETLAHRSTACIAHDCMERKVDIKMVTYIVEWFHCLSGLNPYADGRSLGPR